jgi:hypothetical protein
MRFPANGPKGENEMKTVLAITHGDGSGLGR